MTGRPRNARSESFWSGVTAKLKSGAGVPGGRTFDIRPPSVPVNTAFAGIGATCTTVSPGGKDGQLGFILLQSTQFPPFMNRITRFIDTSLRS
jgi:hypothetical protein